MPKYTSSEDRLRSTIEALILALVILVPILIYPGTANANLIKVTVFNLGMLVLFAMWLVHSVQQGKVRWSWSPLHLPVICFLVWNLVSAILSRYHWISFSEFGKLVSYIFLYFLVTSYFTDRRRIDRLLVAILVGASMTSVYGMLQHSGVDWIQWSDTQRLISSFGNPTFFAGYLVLLLPIVINLFLAQKSTGVRCAFGALAGLMYWCLLLTYTRAAWLGLLFVLVVDGIILWRCVGLPKSSLRINARRGLGFVCVVLALTVLATYQGPSTVDIGQRAISSFQAGEASNVQRMTHWKAALGMFRAHPVIGLGLGTFQVYVPRYQIRQYYTTTDTVIVDHAHNEFLEIAAETGVIGLTTFLWLSATCIGIAARILRKAHDNYWRFLAVGLLSGLIAFMIQNMAGVTMRWVFGGMYFWLLLGLVAVIERLVCLPEHDKSSAEAPTADSKPRSTKRLAVVYGSVALTVAIGTSFIIKPFLSELHTKRGNIAVDENRLDVARSELTAAIRLNHFSLSSYYKLGHVYNQLGMYQRALRAFKELEAMSPDYARMHYNQGVIYCNLSEYIQAIEQYKVAIRLEDSARNHMALAEVYRAIGKDRLALLSADCAIRIARAVGDSTGGSLAEMRLRRGRIYYGLGMLPEALAEYQRVIRAEPFNKLAHFYKGNLLIRINNPSAAIREYESALKFDRKDSRALSNAGTAHYVREGYGEAKRCFLKAIQCNPQDAYAHFNLGLVYCKLGRLVPARIQFELASRLGGKSPIGTQAQIGRSCLGSAQSAVKSGPNASLSRLVPFVYQETSADCQLPLCGPKALQVACERLGIKTRMEDLALRAGTDATGTSLYGLKLAAESVGLSAQGLQVNLAYLMRTPKPVIAWTGGNHFVVVTSAECGELSILDPASGECRLSLDAFVKVWNGYILKVRRRHSSASSILVGRTRAGTTSR